VQVHRARTCGEGASVRAMCGSVVSRRGHLGLVRFLEFLGVSASAQIAGYEEPCILLWSVHYRAATGTITSSHVPVGAVVARQPSVSAP
jgi:hypothetical protein